MRIDQFTAAAAAAKNTHAVDELARLASRANIEGHLADADTIAVQTALQARRRLFGQGRGLPPTKAASGLSAAARRPPRSPDRQASLERRRRTAMSGIVPAKIAATFTQGENAVLTVIGRQCQRHGACSLHIDMVAALAGVCRTTVKRALRQARLLGLVLVKERRVAGRKSLTNIVSIVSKDWLGWLKIGTGGQMKPATDSQVLYSASARPSLRSQEGHSRGEAQDLDQRRVSTGLIGLSRVYG